MTRRLIYFSITLALVLISLFLVNPMIKGQVEQGSLSVTEGRYWFMWASFSISIIMCIFLIIEGRKYVSTYVVVALIIATRVVDVYRYGIYPDATFIGNMTTMYGAAVLALFAIPFFKNPYVKNRFGSFIIGVAALTLIRVPYPYNADIVVWYIKSEMSFASGNIHYFNIIMGIYYIILLLLALAVDRLAADNPRFYTRKGDSYDYQKFGDKKSLR